MNLDETFNKAFTRHGGIEDFSKINAGQNFFSNNLEELQSSLKIAQDSYPNVPKIHLAFISNLGLNAGATKFRDHYFIGIFMGLLASSFDMFGKMLACRNVLSHVGNSSSESDEKSILNLKLEEGAIISALGVEQFPKDPLRQTTSHYYVGLLLEFIVYHEFGHILHGHCGYLNSKSESAIWMEEAEESQINKIGKEFFFACEMDADSFAINAILTKTMKLFRNPSDINPDLKEIFMSWEKFVFDLTFVLYSFLRLGDLVYQNNANTKHPSPFTRIGVINNLISQQFENRFKDLAKVEKIREAIMKGLASAEQAFVAVTYSEIQYEKILAIENDDARKTRDSLLFHWGLARPVLEPFAFTELPPAASIPSGFIPSIF